MQGQRARLLLTPLVGAAGSSLALLKLLLPTSQLLAPARKQLHLDGVDDLAGRAARDDEGAPVHGAPVGRLALHVRAQRAYLKL
eukprot:2077408-Pleurochrysis_carterae.AAC.1